MLVNLSELSMQENFLPLELKGVDVILGMTWLKTMGFIGVNWNELTMEFEVNGTKVVIRGDPTLTKAEVSLKMMAKTWSSTDQGFLVELQGLNITDGNVNPGN